MVYRDNIEDVIKDVYFLKTADYRNTKDYEIAKKIDNNYKRAINLLEEISLLKQKDYEENKED